LRPVGPAEAEPSEEVFCRRRKQVDGPSAARTRFVVGAKGEARTNPAAPGIGGNYDRPQESVLAIELDARGTNDAFSIDRDEEAAEVRCDTLGRQTCGAEKRLDGL
jgi:hypothetical protein